MIIFKNNIYYAQIQILISLFLYDKLNLHSSNWINWSNNDSDLIYSNYDKKCPSLKKLIIICTYYSRCSSYNTVTPTECFAKECRVKNCFGQLCFVVSKTQTKLELFQRFHSYQGQLYRKSKRGHSIKIFLFAVSQKGAKIENLTPYNEFHPVYCFLRGFKNQI